MGKATNIIDKFISAKTMGILGAAGGLMGGGGGWQGLSESVTNAIGGQIHGIPIAELTGIIGEAMPYGIIALLSHIIKPALPANLKKFATAAGSLAGGMGVGLLAGKLLFECTHSNGVPGEMANYGSTGTPYARIPGPYGGVQYTQKLHIPPVSRVPHLATRLTASPKPGK